MTQSRAQRRRFSLIELMVAVAVFTTLAAMGTMYMGRMQATQQVYEASQAAMNALNVCKSWASNHDRPCALAFGNADPNLIAPLHQGGSMFVTTFYGNPHFTTIDGFYATDRCWDLLPADPIAGPCSTAWYDDTPWNSYTDPNPNMFWFHEYDSGGQIKEADVVLIGVGGERNTLRTSLAADGNGYAGQPSSHGGLDIAPLAPYAGAIVFMPNGRVLNAEEDFDCEGHINFWFGNRPDWQEDQTRNYVEMSVARNGKLTWRNGDEAHVNPYPGGDVALFDASKNACGS